MECFVIRFIVIALGEGINYSEVKDTLDIEKHVRAFCDTLNIAGS